MTNAGRIKVCHVSDIPAGEMRCVEVRQVKLLVANTDQGFFVSDEMCTHEDARLCDGNLNGTLVKCPLHGSRFDLVSGKVLDDPAEEDLMVYPTTIDNQSVYIQLPIDSKQTNN